MQLKNSAVDVISYEPLTNSNLISFKSMNVSLPENTGEITLGQYQELDKLYNREDLTDTELQYRKIKAITKLEYKTISKMPLTDLNDFVRMIDEALEEDAPFNNRVTIGNTEFGFIPNFDDIKAKEFFDLDSYDITTENLHLIMAILYRPIDGKDILGNYKIAEYAGTKGWADIMKSVPLSIVNGALAFFLTLSKDLEHHIQRYIAPQLVKDNQQ